MRPHADLVLAVASLQKLASDEAEKLALELSKDIIFPDDHQLPEDEERMRINNLKAQFARADYVMRNTGDMLLDLLKVQPHK